MAGSCVGRSVAKIRLQQKQTRKALNIKPQMPDVQDFLSENIQKQNKNRFEFVSFCYMIVLSENTNK